MTDRLTGRRIVVTRPAERAADLVQRLREAGAEPILYPTIVTVPPASWHDVDAALHALTAYDWVVFTSPAGVRAACVRAADLGIGQADWNGIQIAAVGPATARALHEFDLHAAVVPAEAIGTAIAGAVGEPPGQRFLLLRGNLARTELPATLRAHGAAVHDVETYTTVILTEVDTTAADLVRTSDAITFSSPSAVQGFLNALGPGEWNGTAAIVTIGPTTSAAVRGAGLTVCSQSEAPSADGMIKALVMAFNEEQRSGVRYDNR